MRRVSNLPYIGIATSVHFQPTSGLMPGLSANQLMADYLKPYWQNDLHYLTDALAEGDIIVIEHHTHVKVSIY